MPTSANRRRVEIPAALFARLEERARRDGQTVAGLVAALLAGALDAPVGEQAGQAGDPEVRAILRQMAHNDTVQLRELRFVQQRLDLALRLLAEGPGVGEGEAGKSVRERILAALTENYVAAPWQPISTLVHTGEPQPVQSRTLWQRAAGTPQREATGEREE